MAKTDNLKDFLTDLADGIRVKKGTSDPINPQDFRSEIDSIEGGTPVDKTVDLNFITNAYTVVEDASVIDEMRTDASNIGKWVKYVGASGKYTTDTFYEILASNQFNKNTCHGSAKEVASGVTLTSSVSCNVGDLIVVGFITRSELSSLSSGWTLISTSRPSTELDTSGSTSWQTQSFAYKYATSTSESITVTQKSSGRIYINMVSFSNACGFVPYEYEYRTGTNITTVTVSRHPSEVILWCVTRNIWSTTTPYPTWTSYPGMILSQLGSNSQSRLLLAVDDSDVSSVSFTVTGSTSADCVMVGALGIEFYPCKVSPIDNSRITIGDAQTVEADENEAIKSVTINKPEALIPENIKGGVEVAGVKGTLDTPKEELRCYDYIHINTANNSVVLRAYNYSTAYSMKRSYNISIPNTYMGLNTVVNSLNAMNISNGIFTNNTISINRVTFGENLRFVGNSMYKAFANCKYLNTSITIPNGVVNLANTFQYCSNFTWAVSFPNSVESMQATFYYCNQFNQPVTLPANLKNMYMTFSACTNFGRSVTIPNGVTNMVSTFSTCNKFVSSINIPNNVTNMWGTFYGCRNYTGTIRIYANNVVNVTNMLYNKFNNKRATIYCYAGSNTETMLRGNAAANSVLGVAITWSENASNGCFYNTTLNLYCYNNLV